jgi:Outer membrane protein beta-barrel domain
MRRNHFTTLSLSLAGAAMALLFLTSGLAEAQPAEGADRPTATAPPTSTPASNPAPATAPTAGGPKANGLVLQVKFGTNLFTALNGSVASVGDLSGGLLVGYKMGRLTLGLGLELAHVGGKEGTTDAKMSDSLMLFEPTLEYYLAISNPLVLYLSVGFHVGFLKHHYDPGDDTTDVALGFHGGLGMRYFMHPRFAIGVEGGVRGVWLFVDRDPDDSDVMNALAIYAAVLLTAIW